MYAATISGQRFVFPRLADVLAKASPLRIRLRLGKAPQGAP